MRKVIEEFYCDVCGAKVDSVYGIMMPMWTDQGGIEKEVETAEDSAEESDSKTEIEMVSIEPTLVISDVEMCWDCIRKNVNIYTDNLPEGAHFQQKPAPSNFAPFVPEDHPELVTALA